MYLAGIGSHPETLLRSLYHTFFKSLTLFYKISGIRGFLFWGDLSIFVFIMKQLFHHWPCCPLVVVQDDRLFFRFIPQSAERITEENQRIVECAKKRSVNRDEGKSLILDKILSITVIKRNNIIKNDKLEDFCSNYFNKEKNLYCPSIRKNGKTVPILDKCQFAGVY